MGDHRNDSELDDYSLKGISSSHQKYLNYLYRLQAINDDGFPEQDRLSHI